MYPKLDVQRSKSGPKEGKKMSEYIDRQSLINHLNQSAAEYYSRAVERVIELEPAADVAPVRRGQWIEEKNTFPGFNLANNVCSECGECAGTWPKRLGPRDKYAFCPWCGAKMEVPNDD